MSTGRLKNDAAHGLMASMATHDKLTMRLKPSKTLRLNPEPVEG
jgi:hypothetical protein